MALDAYRQQVDVIPLEDWGKACTAYESISGIPSPLKPGEDVLSHLMYHGDPFEIYRKEGKLGELCGFACAMFKEELPERPFLRGRIAKIIAKVSEAGERALRWDEMKKGHETYKNSAKNL